MCTLSGLPEHLLTYLYSDWLELQGLVRLSTALSRADEKTLLTDIMCTASFCNSTKTFEDALKMCKSPTDLVNALRWLNAKIGRSEKMRLSVRLSRAAVLKLERCCSDQAFRFIHKIVVLYNCMEDKAGEEGDDEGRSVGENVGDSYVLVEVDEEIDEENSGEDEDDDEDASDKDGADDDAGCSDEEENAEVVDEEVDEKVDEEANEDTDENVDEVDNSPAPHRFVIQHDIGKWFSFAQKLSLGGYDLPFDETVLRSILRNNPQLSLEVCGSSETVVRDLIRLGVADRVVLMDNSRVDGSGLPKYFLRDSMQLLTNLQEVHLMMYNARDFSLATVKPLPHLVICCWDNGENAPPVKLSANFFDDWSTTTLSTLRLHGFVCDTDVVVGLYRNHGHSLLEAVLGNLEFKRDSLSDKGQLAVSYANAHLDDDDEDGDLLVFSDNNPIHASDPHLFDLAQAIPPISKLVLSPSYQLDVFAVALALQESSRHVITELNLYLSFGDGLKKLVSRSLTWKPLFQHLAVFAIRPESAWSRYCFNPSDLNKLLGYLTVYSPFLEVLEVRKSERSKVSTRVDDSVLQQLLISKKNLRRLCLEELELNHSMILSTLTEVSVRTGYVYASLEFPRSKMPKTVVESAITSGLKIKGLQYEDVAWVNLPEPLTVAELRDRRLVTVIKDCADKLLNGDRRCYL